MTPPASRMGELKQLLRLREIRQEAARVEREARRTARDAAMAVLHEHQARLESLRLQRGALVNWAGGDGAMSMARLHTFASARKGLLDESCERAEYASIDDAQAVAEAERALAQAHERWVRACASRQSVERLQARTRASLAREAELRAEREAEPARTSPPLYAARIAMEGPAR